MTAPFSLGLSLARCREAVGQVAATQAMAQRPIAMAGVDAFQIGLARAPAAFADAFGDGDEAGLQRKFRHGHQWIRSGVPGNEKTARTGSSYGSLAGQRALEAVALVLRRGSAADAWRPSQGPRASG